MQFQLVHAKIALAGDLNTVVFRSVDHPLTYPEYLLLEYIHGPGSTMNACAAGYVERSLSEERARLRETYGTENVDSLFGKGDFTPLPTEGPELPDAAEIAEAEAAAEAVRARKKASAEASAVRKGNLQQMNKRRQAEAQKASAEADAAGLPALDDIPTEV